MRFNKLVKYINICYCLPVWKSLTSWSALGLQVILTTLVINIANIRSIRFVLITNVETLGIYTKSNTWLLKIILMQYHLHDNNSMAHLRMELKLQWSTFCVFLTANCAGHKIYWVEPNVQNPNQFELNQRLTHTAAYFAYLLPSVAFSNALYIRLCLFMTLEYGTYKKSTI